MTKYAITLAALCALAGSAAAEKILEKFEYPPEIAVVHMGAKPAALDESRWPDVKFYYIPGLVLEEIPKTLPQDYKLTGTPEIFVNWYNQAKEALGSFKGGGARMTNRAILFDKLGVAAFDGNLGRADTLVDMISRKTKDPLKDVLKTLIKKGKNAKADKREFKPVDKEGLLGLKMPEFEVVDGAGKAVSINAVITGSAKPLLVIFAYFPEDTNYVNAEAAALTETKAETEKAKSAGAFFGAMAKGAFNAKTAAVKSDLDKTGDELTGREAVISYPKLLDKVELQFFGRDMHAIAPAPAPAPAPEAAPAK
ncbi:MAG: hypothetical protein A3J79_04670 [Elusimicrobia bacterium RIFOXYB2_FULL_62_6]|nr:MAG: hypothetical protein A3J79_04670 [Elusimicrobia bacterium RIFOXYB2_FULL_62_6]